MESDEHYNALLLALASGCNLIDTSTNYMGGESEELVGKVLAENPQHEAFVITKAGYIQTSNLETDRRLSENALDEDQALSLSSHFKYSISPQFLSTQIETSRSRLRRKQIDGFLLHNPEYYFDQKEVETLEDEYYRRIDRAFRFLEEKVSEGSIRYYGISSNTFPLSTNEKTTTNLNKVLAIARGISKENHFKLILFPFNLVETEAATKHHEGQSLIEIAKANDIITVSNRPLNAKSSSGSLRIATYFSDIRRLDAGVDSLIFRDCVELIRKQLKKIGMSDDPMQFPIIKILSENWMKIETPEAVTQIFGYYFNPFLYQIYEGSIPEEERRVYSKLHGYAQLYSRRTMTQKAILLRKEMIERGIMNERDERPLARIACEYCLDSGIDHVLVGMRTTKYVDCLRPLF